MGGINFRILITAFSKSIPKTAEHYSFYCAIPDLQKKTVAFLKKALQKTLLMSFAKDLKAKGAQV